MAADWVKIRNKYINSTMSQREIAKKYGVSVTNVKEHCRREGWVELRAKQQTIKAEKLSQKTAESYADKEAERLSRISTISDTLLTNLEKAVMELDVTVVHNKRSKKIIDSEGGKRREITDTTESIDKVSGVVDVDRIQRIAAVLQSIAEISALANRMPDANSNADESDMVKAIREAYMENMNHEPK